MHQEFGSGDIGLTLCEDSHMTVFVSVYLVGLLVLQFDFVCFPEYFCLKNICKISVNEEQHPQFV